MSQGIRHIETLLPAVSGTGSSGTAGAAIRFASTNIYRLLRRR